MEKKHIISLAGDLASGKGETSKILTEKLGYGIYRNGQYFRELAKNMNIEINSEIRIEGENINVLLVTDNNNIMIGKDGKTLNAIQIVLRQYMTGLNKLGLRLIVDVGNYKNKKLKNLEYQVRKICKEVLKTKVEVKLDPMNSYERRKVHSIVSEFESLESVSYGEDPNRYTVIKFKD